MVIIDTVVLHLYKFNPPLKYVLRPPGKPTCTVFTTYAFLCENCVRAVRAEGFGDKTMKRCDAEPAPFISRCTRCAETYKMGRQNDVSDFSDKLPLSYFDSDDEAV